MIDFKDIRAVYMGNTAVTAVYAPDGTQIWPVGATVSYSLTNIRVRYSNNVMLLASGRNYAVVVADIVDGNDTVVAADVVCEVTAFSGEGFSMGTLSGIPVIRADGRGTTLGDGRTCTVTAISKAFTVDGTTYQLTKSGLALTIAQEPNTRTQQQSETLTGEITLGDWDIGQAQEDADQSHVFPSWEGDECRFSYDARRVVRTYWAYTSGSEATISEQTEVIDIYGSNWSIVSDKAWCTPTFEQGSDTGTLRVTENDTGAERTATLSLKYHDTEVASKLITQGVDES